MENVTSSSSHNMSSGLLEPIITISIIFICLYMIALSENRFNIYLKRFILDVRFFITGIIKCFSEINYVSLVFSSFFFISYFILKKSKYMYINVSNFCVNSAYYEQILNSDIKLSQWNSIFDSGLTRNVFINFIHSFKIFFHIFFNMNENLSRTIFSFVRSYVLLTLYAKFVNRAMFFFSIFSHIILSGYMIVTFMKKYYHINYYHCGDDSFSFMLLLFFLLKNPYLNTHEYYSRGCDVNYQGEAGTRFLFSFLFFINYFYVYEQYYEIKVLVSTLTFFILFFRETSNHFKIETFRKVLWLTTYYFVNYYLPFTFSRRFEYKYILSLNFVQILRKEIAEGVSLFKFNTTSGVVFNYLITKAAFFWIPYILFKDKKTADNSKILIAFIIVANLIATCTYMVYDKIFPGLFLNIILLYFLNKL